MIQQIAGFDFLKFRAHEMGLVRLVVFGTGVEIPKVPGFRMSLTGCDGYKRRMKLRNDAGLERAATDEITPQQAGMAKLFGTALNKPAKQPRVNATQLRLLREDPQLLEFEIPGAPSLLVTAVRPVHPCDELQIKARCGHAGTPHSLHSVQVIVH